MYLSNSEGDMAAPTRTTLTQQDIYQEPRVRDLPPQALTYCIWGFDYNFTNNILTRTLTFNNAQSSW